MVVNPIYWVLFFIKRLLNFKKYAPAGITTENSIFTGGILVNKDMNKFMTFGVVNLSGFKEAINSLGVSTNIRTSVLYNTLLLERTLSIH